MIIPKLVAGLSQVRPERLIEKRVDNVSEDKSMLLTKSSLALPTNRTVVYIYRDPRNHERNIEVDRMARNRSKENRIE